MKENIIKSLIDARVVEALKKKITAKLTTIAQHMGSPILGEYSYSSMLPDFWEYEIDDPYDANRVIDASNNASEMNLGYSYDSLRYGINFDIVIRIYADKINIVRASLNGNIVYLEEEGELKSYVPNPIWEQHMEDLYVHAHKLEKQVLDQEKAIKEEELKKSKKTFLQKLKLIWGYE
jgi:hypothetical protein